MCVKLISKNLDPMGIALDLENPRFSLFNFDNESFD